MCTSAGEFTGSMPVDHSVRCLFQRQMMGRCLHSLDGLLKPVPGRFKGSMPVFTPKLFPVSKPDDETMPKTGLKGRCSQIVSP